MGKSSTSEDEKTVGGRDRVRKGLEPKHPDAAGIDVGSRVHYVAVPPDRDEQPVRRFGCTTPELHEMAKWLRACDIRTVVVESTGVYWIPVVQVLEEYSLEVLLVDARHVRNVPGRKTDVQDCQWLQELHTYGLLSPAFRPSQEILPLRSYWRHRAELVGYGAQQIQRMHKALEQMNVQVQKIVSDLSGQTGMRIIRAIVQGERNPVRLAQLRHASVKHDEETYVKALTGTYRTEHVFALRHAVELYDTFQEKIAECDREIASYMQSLQGPNEGETIGTKPPKKRGRFRRKNQPHFDLREELYRFTGVDLTQIDGIDAMTAQTVISEQGIDMSRFPTEKHFTSHLGLCPNNRISGGKVLRSRTRKVQSRAAKALRVAAQSLHRSRTAIGAFYRRLRARLGAPKAITATARKIAIQIYRMLKYGKDYIDQGEQAYQEQYKERLTKNLAKQARKLGLQLLNAQTGQLLS